MRIPLLLLVLLLDIVSASAQNSFNIQLRRHVEINHPESFTELIVNAKGDEIKVYCEHNNLRLRELGGNYNAVSIQNRDIESFSSMDFVNWIEISNGKTGYLLNDSMLVNNRIVEIHDSSEWNGRNYTGRNVLIGFIDTGIDFTHPDFLDSLGDTRVVAIWDQAADTLISSKIPQPYNYGQYWSSSEINSGNSSHDDELLSHGTNVVGVACGNGKAVRKFKGVAPDSKIMMVASDFSRQNWLNTVADGVEMIFKKADSLNIPCVVNISAGTYLGSHDGFDAAAQRIDNLIKAKNGRSVVCAAGNLGTLPFHLGYQITADTNFTWFQYNPAINGLYFELWADTSDFNQVSYAIGADRVNPSYKFRGNTTFRSVNSNLNTTITDSIFQNGNHIATVQTYAEKQGDKYLVQFYLPTPDSTQYNYRLMLTGMGNFDLWTDKALGWSSMVADNLPSSSVFPDILKYKLPDTLKTIVGSFASLPSVITVGNYINRDRYIDVNNTLQVDTTLFGEDLIPGEIAANSCTGPNRINQLKPDISATGDIILSANRLASIPLHIANNQSNRIALGGMHKRNGGTSMASPVVAGIVALLLEKCENLSYLDIKNAIIGNSIQDTFTSVIPNQKWGHGKVDGWKTLSSTNWIPDIQPSSDILLCKGDSIVVSGQSGYQYYYWTTGDTISSVVIKGDVELAYQVRDSSGCWQFSDTIIVMQVEGPQKPTIITKQDSLLTTQLSNLYQWYLDSIPLSGETQNYIVPKSDGYYYVAVIDSNNCSNTSNELNVKWVGIHQQNEKRIGIFPNPGKGFFNIQIRAPEDIDGLLIYDSYGKKIEFDLLSNQNSNYELQIIDPIPGIYFVVVAFEDEVKSSKIIVN